MKKYDISKLLLLHCKSLIDNNINDIELSEEVVSELTITLDDSNY